MIRVLVDAQGYFSAGSASSLHPLNIVRVADTRSGAPLAGHGTLTLSLGGKGGVPSSGLTMAAVNITVTQPGDVGYLTAYQSGTGRPLASNVNFVRSQTIANLAFVKVASSGGLSIYNGSASPVHVIVDVEGYGSAP